MTKNFASTGDTRREEDHVQRDRPRPLRLHGRGRSQQRRDHRRRRRHRRRRAGDAGDGRPGHRARAQGHRQAHQVRGAVALPRGARARRLGLQGAGDHRLRDLPRHDRRARQGGLGFRVRPLPAPVPRRRDHPRPHLADRHLQAQHDALSRQAPRRAAAHRPRPYRRRHRRLRAGCQRRVLRRHRRVQVGLLLRGRAFHRLADHARAPRSASRPMRWCRAAAMRWSAPTRWPRASR